MASKKWVEEIKTYSTTVENGVLINEHDLDILYKKYRFKPDIHTLSMFDRKRQKTVIKILKNPKDKDDLSIIVDGEWLLLEAIKTKSKELKNILRNNPNFYLYYKRYREFCERERKIFYKSLSTLQDKIEALGEIPDELEETCKI